MLFQVDPLAAQPIFEQLVFQVKTAVARGELSQGDKLPSVRELAKELAINPNTVSRSYQALETEGVIVRRQGAGCYVRDGASALRDEERRRRLEELLSRSVTEAYHLGFDGEEIKSALDACLREVRFTRSDAK